MFRVALLTSTVIALAGARIYERCELARDLQKLGVDREHVATWVCIAFHESRFDTDAHNAGSGDHGLFQISELYWCGPGKACGVPCSAFHDDDITDDVQCALRVYREHTRLQGDGFLAWVVYPHHCKTNAKKYIVDCDKSTKHYVSKFDDRARNLKTSEVNATKQPAVNYQPQPRYLIVNSIFQENYINQLARNYNNNNKGSFNWLNYKVDNIDDLKLPDVLEHQRNRVTEFTTRPTTTTTIDPDLVGIKPPSPRKIESNQFRRRKTFTEPPFLRNRFDFNGKTRTMTTTEESYTNKMLSYEDLAQNPYLNFSSSITSKSYTELPRREIKFTDIKEYIPTTKKPSQTDENSTMKILTYEDLSQNPFLRSLPGLHFKFPSETQQTKLSSSNQNNLKDNTFKIINPIDSKKQSFMETRDDSVPTILSLEELSKNPFLKHVPFDLNLKPSGNEPSPETKSKNFIHHDIELTSTTAIPTATPMSLSLPENNSSIHRKTFQSELSSKALSTVTMLRGKTRYFSKFNKSTADQTTTQRPKTLTTLVQHNRVSDHSGRFNVNQNGSFEKAISIAPIEDKISERTSTPRPVTTKNYNRSRSRTKTSTLLSTTHTGTTVTPSARPQTSAPTTTLASSTLSRHVWEVTHGTEATTTSKPRTTTSTSSAVGSTTSSTQSTSSLERVTTTTEVASVKTTQSIFDLYLRPTRPTFKPFQFTPFKNSVFKLNIFSGGTTKPPHSFVDYNRHLISKDVKQN